jgi:hypothetical protein
MLRAASAGATATNERCTAPRESTQPNDVEASAIDTAVKAANSPSATTASTWSGMPASSSTPTPAEPPMPCTRPMP